MQVLSLDRDMLVGFQNPRVTATFSKGVVIRVIKTEYKKVLQRFYSSKGVKRDLAFAHKWKLLESNLIKDIKKARWPRLATKANNLLKLLQTKICHLSLTGSDEMAMKLIEAYSMNIVIRYIAINKIAVSVWLQLKVSIILLLKIIVIKLNYYFKVKKLN